MANFLFPRPGPLYPLLSLAPFSLPLRPLPLNSIEPPSDPPMNIQIPFRHRCRTGIPEPLATLHDDSKCQYPQLCTAHISTPKLHHFQAQFGHAGSLQLHRVLPQAPSMCPGRARKAVSKRIALCSYYSIFLSTLVQNMRFQYVFIHKMSFILHPAMR